MLQQTVTYFMVPPLILLGLTDSLLKPVYNQRILSFFLTFFTKPVVALSLFNILFSLYYLPMIFDTIMVSSLNQTLAMIILLPLSYVMWWPLVSPAKNNSTLKPLMKIIYIVGMGAFMTPLAALIIFSSNVLYRTYESLPRVYDIAILNDQQAGGVAMKVIQMIIYCIMIAYAFSEAVKLDKRQTEEATEQVSPDKSF
ncbi:cytochrome c oxidase assembly protein [Alkalihalobacillus oceani]|uniref:Cytochrome c oxidase assembly protein n=1 Tax=Halalkalibacter oceani TaxID=1653776 RepID=A0A9X2DS54_9BACI|nr:cytochrome c oxidase assembly protein [Halalkalibacter oceani]